MHASFLTYKSQPNLKELSKMTVKLLKLSFALLPLLIAFSAKSQSVGQSNFSTQASLALC